MPTITFQTQPDQSPFFKDIIEEGYHIFSIKNSKIPGFYPNEFPDYPGVSIKDLKVGDKITVRVFFRVGTGNQIRADGGYIELEVEHLEDASVMAEILTELPEEFPLSTGASIDVFEEEILFRKKVTDH